MKTFKRASHEVYHTQQQRNCTHPDESVQVCYEGGIKFVGGEIDDTIRETLVCTACGLEVVMVDDCQMDRYISHEWGWA
jgi:hypothetical protein